MIYVLAAIFYSFLGLAIFVSSFWIVDRLTPYNIWKEIVDEKNLALAVLASGVSLGLCIIIASAIH